MKTKSFWNPYEKPDDDDNSGDQWLTSYGDMMTLLLVFFVLLVSISTIDPVRMQHVTQQMRSAIGGDKYMVPTLKEIEQELRESIETQNLDDMVEVNRNKDGVELVLQGESFFPSGSANLFPSTYPFLDEIAWQVSKNPYLVSIEGHTDNIPIRSDIFPSNWELSGARAAAVVRYLETKGIARNRFRIVGWADARPVDPITGNSTAKARSMNRRVIITFMNEFATREDRSKWLAKEID